MVALSDTESVASEPPPNLVDASEHDLNGVPPLNRGRRLRLTWDPDPHVASDARAAERLVHDLATRLGPVPIGAEVPGAAAAAVVTHEHVPLIWAASGSEETNPVLQWLVAATSAVEEPIEFYEGGIIASDAVRTGWNALRAVLRGWGVTEREGLSTWPRNNGFVATAPGNHIAARAQEFIFSEAIAADARVALLEAVYVCCTVHVSRQLAVPPTIRESPRPRVVQRRTFPSSFPDGSWEQMDDLELSDLFLMRIPMLRSCPHFFASEVATEFRRSFGGETLRKGCRRRASGVESVEAVRPRSIDVVASTKRHRFTWQRRACKTC